VSEKNGEAPVPKPSIEELRAGIRQTRAELGETMQALAAKADVKSRAMDQVEQARQRVRQAASGAGVSPVPVALLVAGVVAVVGIVLVVRGRRR
jgi:DNA-binding XRE family transcriptional regulator